MGPPLGQLTRGTTGYNRLRRSDRWLVHAPRVRGALLSAAEPLVVDLGYGALPVTTLELAARLRAVRPDVRVVGLEIHPDRVRAAQAATKRDRRRVRARRLRTGRSATGSGARVQRAAPVPRRRRGRRVDADAGAAGARRADRRRHLRRARTDAAAGCCSTTVGPVSLTLACDPFAIERPSDLAERLPKVLIHHNVPRSADPPSADRRRPRVGGRRGARRVRPAGALAGDAGGAAPTTGFPSSRRGAGCATACSPSRGAVGRT